MATEQTSTPVRSVYFGDVVAASTSAMFVGPTPWWLFVLLLGIPGAMAVALFLFHVDWLDGVFWPALLICPGVALYYACVAARTERLRRRLQAQQARGEETYGSLATRLWEQTLTRTRRRMSFDAGAWIDRVGPDGPRIILLDVNLPDIPPVEEISEEIPLGVDAALGKAERTRRIWQVVLFGFNLILIGSFAFVRPFMWYRVWPALTWATFVAVALYRLGLRPISLGASSVVPGMVRVTRGRLTREFQRSDSVLVLMERSGAVWGWAFRRDGASARLMFHSGRDDPGLRQLIERWCRRPTPRENGGRPARVHSVSGEAE